MLIQDTFLWENLESWNIVFFEVVKDLLECQLSQDQIVDVHELKELREDRHQEKRTIEQKAVECEERYDESVVIIVLELEVLQVDLPVGYCPILLTENNNENGV